MARRPEINKEDVLTRQELNALAQRLTESNLSGIESFYRSAHHKCSLQPRWLPSPRCIQELVQAWKALRKRRR